MPKITFKRSAVDGLYHSEEPLIRICPNGLFDVFPDANGEDEVTVSYRRTNKPGYTKVGIRGGIFRYRGIEYKMTATLAVALRDARYYDTHIIYVKYVSPKSKPKNPVVEIGQFEKGCRQGSIWPITNERRKVYRIQYVNVYTLGCVDGPIDICTTYVVKYKGHWYNACRTLSNGDVVYNVILHGDGPSISNNPITKKPKRWKAERVYDEN